MLRGRRSAACPVSDTSAVAAPTCPAIGPLDSAAVSTNPSTATTALPAMSQRARVFSGVQPSGLPARRQLPRRVPQLHRDAGRLRRHLLHRRLPRPDVAPTTPSSSAATPTRWRSACWRSGSTRSERSSSASRTGPSTSSSCGSSSTVDAGALGRAHAVVQGEEAQPARRRQPRAADLPGAPGRRYRHLQRAATCPSARTRRRTSSWRARSCAPSIAATASTSSSRRRSSPTRPSSWAPTACNKMSKSLGNVIEIFADEDTSEAGHEHGHRHAAHQAHRPGPAGGLQRLPAAPLLQPDDYETSGTASARRAPAASTPRRLLADRMLGHFAEARERQRASSNRRPATSRRSSAPAPSKLAPLAAETLRECHERMGLGTR